MKQANILLVEDDLSLLNGMRDYLELSGYQVSTAENGREALALLDSGGSLPSLIVSDIMMPSMDGYEFLAAVRKRPEWVSVPFIFLSAKSTRQDVRRGKRRGADDYVTKPFEVEDLLVAIQARLERYAELERLNENRLVAMKKRILTTLNHEFRTPLSYVIAYSDLIMNGEEELDPGELNDYLTGIHNGGERLMRLVEDFLLLVEMETGRAATAYALRKETILNLGEFVGEIVKGFEAEARNAGLDLTYRKTRELPPVEGDFEFLKAAIGHLIDNAIKFSAGHGKEVSVSLSHEDDGVVVRVEDDGIGIAPEQRQYLFDVFSQIDRDLLEQQGMGVGLAIVRHVAKLHGGQVGLESKPGAGSTFALSIPTIE